jgi:hypothetical protein
VARAKSDKATVMSLRRDLETYAKQDKQDHARLYAAVGNLKRNVNGMRGEVSGMRGQLKIMTDILEEQRDIRATERKDALDAKEVERQDELGAHQFRRKLILKVATVAAAAGGGLVHLLHHLL